MKRIVKRFLKAYLACIASNMLDLMFSLGGLFYFSVCTSMYYDGNEMWHQKPHDIIFFAPMAIMLVVTLLTFVFHFIKAKE